MIRRPPRSTLFPTRRSSDLARPPVEERGVRCRASFVRAGANLPQMHEAIGSHVHLWEDRKSTRLNSSHLGISYAVFCLKKKKNSTTFNTTIIHHRPTSDTTE